jgi:hypothetical protein
MQMDDPRRALGVEPRVHEELIAREPDGSSSHIPRSMTAELRDDRQRS